jgi:hypothetical protein
LKITASLIQDVKQIPPAYRRTARPALPADDAVQSTISDYLTELRHAARTEAPFGGVRSDVIAKLREEWGTFGGEADTERALDALMKEL